MRPTFSHRLFQTRISRPLLCAIAGFLALAASACGGSPGSADSPEEVATTEAAVSSGAVKIACGGPAESPFIADTDSSGGSTITRTNAIDVSAVYDPAPTAVYQSQRYGNFTYTLPGFSAGSYNKVRLHFADTHWTTPGSRMFNVFINGTQVLTNFDIVETVGAGNKALVENFTLPANSSGQYVIQFSTVVDAATVSGIEVAPSNQAGTPTTLNGMAYAKQCAQQLVPTPPPFGGSNNSCSACFAGGKSNCIGCAVGQWQYEGQLNDYEVSGGQSFNGTAPADIYYFQFGGPAPGLCMISARQNEDNITATDFFGVICQSANTGAECFWDQTGNFEYATSQFAWDQNTNHLVIPSTAVTIASTTQNPTEFVGGADLIATSQVHFYQTPCSDCHAGRNGFNNHPGTATDLLNRGVVLASNWFPTAWPAPIVPAWDSDVGGFGGPWPENPGPQVNQGSSACFSCHNSSTGTNLGGAFPSISSQLPEYCDQVFQTAVSRGNDSCPNTFPWNGQGSPKPDLWCPTGAMPPSSAASSPFSGDQFTSGMLTSGTGQCNAEFRTQWLPPPGGGKLLNGPGAISTSTASGYPTAVYGVAPGGQVLVYNVESPGWVGTNGNVTALSVGGDYSVWAIVNTTSNGSPVGYTCAAVPGSCLPSGNCKWQCNWSAPNAFNWAQIAAGAGSRIWAVDSSKLGLWEYQSNGFGQYSGSQFVQISTWLSSNAINQIAAGAGGDVWVLSALGNLTHYSSPDFLSVAPPAGSKVVSIAAAGTSDVWAASSSGLFRYLGGDSWERHCLTTGCNTTAFTSVSAGAGFYGNAEVWALDSSGNTYRVDRTKGSTTDSIVKVPGTLTQIAAGGQGDVWGINSAGTVYAFQ
jgi:hypothetical protein